MFIQLNLTWSNALDCIPCIYPHKNKPIIKDATNPLFGNPLPLESLLTKKPIYKKTLFKKETSKKKKSCDQNPTEGIS